MGMTSCHRLRRLGSRHRSQHSGLPASEYGERPQAGHMGTGVLGRGAGHYVGFAISRRVHRHHEFPRRRSRRDSGGIRILGMVFAASRGTYVLRAVRSSLTACYEKKDALRVQGINDLVIFGVAGAGSLASGYAYTAIGWDGLVYVVCGLMGLAGIFLAGSYRAASRRADGPEGSKSGSLSFTISPMTGGCPAPAGMVEPWGKSVSSTSV